MVYRSSKGYFRRISFLKWGVLKDTRKLLKELLSRKGPQELGNKSESVGRSFKIPSNDKESTGKSDFGTTMNMCVKTAKAKIRDEIKKQITSLNLKEQERQSSIIVEKLLGLTLYKDSRRVSIYLSMKDEVQTDKIVEDILSSGKECFIPRYTKTGMEMLKLHSLQDLRTLPVTKWNIRQPPITDERENAMERGLDLMIVPGLAFTENGSRLGRGKGYYDRYLTEYHKKTGKTLKTIGLAFQQQILNELPTDEHDFKLDLVMYPEYNLNVVTPEASKEYDLDGFK